jgi:peptidoglycan/xylan/chitin deacetylase (PgdA/CDA1 family)
MAVVMRIFIVLSAISTGVLIAPTAIALYRLAFPPDTEAVWDSKIGWRLCNGAIADWPAKSAPECRKLIMCDNGRIERGRTNAAQANDGGDPLRRLTAMKRVTLSFDNGPTPGITDRVLDILERAGIRATFFVIGRKLEDPSAAALMREAHAAGHWIGNHALTHSIALGDRPDAAYAAAEIGETQERIGAFSHPGKLFRPYGKSGLIGPHLFSLAAKAYLLEHRYCTLLWNSVPGDWRDPEGWVDVLLADVQAHDWTAAVIHDVAGACLARLPELLDRLADLGVEWRQEFPESVVMTRDGETINLPDAYVADCR